MKRNRDDFNKRTRNDLALRASYLCSLCKCSTVGPSDEGKNAVTMTGVAAHICAAAPGPGARRYDLNMSSEERSHINNGIWLCVSCSVLIDRDEKRFTVEKLHQIKSEHESSRLIGTLEDSGENDIVAIGPDIIALGLIIRSASEGLRIRLSHFVSGSVRDLWALQQNFSKWSPERRYVLCNELGFGGLLNEPPVIERVNNSYEIQLALQKQVMRQDARAEISTMCHNTLKRISGIEAFIQIFENVLGMAQGTGFTDLSLGSDMSDLYWRYRGSPWFKTLAMVEMIRLSSIPRLNKSQQTPTTPLLVVNRVNNVEIPSFELVDQKLEILVDFDLEGIGQWKHILSVFISTPEQLIESREKARQMNHELF
ncbi:hypothetical protein [Enterobacter cloacae]|uniref:hypothetical protein n=1 Tax=Enterobacter cloacae TaxID=550 RepID=UPI0028E7B8D0|nr:hypothetical protein [Enterobacter cloacae]WNT35816.1 hypothetical protein RRL13_18990 [Enterobacter cloacae]